MHRWLLLFCCAPFLHAQDADIRALLKNSADAWNRGDLVAFVSYYDDSPETTFIGREVTHGGRQAILERYRKGYSSPEAMGTLTFSEIEVRSLAPDVALADGKWELKRNAAGGGDASGRFTLILRKTPSGWRIIYDHSSDSTVKTIPGPTAMASPFSEAPNPLFATEPVGPPQSEPASEAEKKAISTTISADHDVVKVGSEVRVILATKNISDKPIPYAECVHYKDMDEFYEFKVWRADGVPVQHRSHPPYTLNCAFDELQPGATISDYEPLSNDWDLNRPGKYFVQLDRHGTPSKLTIETSNVITVTVVP